MTVIHKKQIIDKVVEISFDWEYQTSIEDMKEDIKRIELLGATHININMESDGYGDKYLLFSSVEKRLENDEEFKSRKDYAKNAQKSIEEREISLLKSLKEKYEK